MASTRPDGSSAKQQRVAFTLPAAERIAKAVRKVEQGDRGSAGLTFSPRDTSRSAGPRLGKITQTWSKGFLATVARLNGDGSNAQQTFQAINYFATVTVPAGQERKVLCVRVGTLWLLAAAEC